MYYIIHKYICIENNIYILAKESMDVVEICVNEMLNLHCWWWLYAVVLAKVSLSLKDF